MAKPSIKGVPKVDSTRISGSGNLDPSGTITVTLNGLVQIEDLMGVSYALNSGGTNNDIVLDVVTVSGNTVDVEFADGAGGAPASDDLAELAVSAKGF